MVRGFRVSSSTIVQANLVVSLRTMCAVRASVNSERPNDPVLDLAKDYFTVRDPLLHRMPVDVPLPLPTPLATPPLAPLAVPVIPPRAIPLPPLAPLVVDEACAPPLVLPLAGVLADGTLLYLLGGLEVVGGCSTNEVSVVRKVASTSGGAVCEGT